MGYRDIPIATERCPGCNQEVPRGTGICPACGSPVEISQFAELELKLKPDLRRARTFLGVVAALGAAGVLIAVASGHSVAAPILSFVFSGTCFLVAFKRPLGASIAAMAMFLLNQGLAIGMGRIDALFSGLLLKVVLIVMLSAAIRSGYRARDLRGLWRKRDFTIGVGVLIGSAVLGILLGVAADLR